MYKNKKEFTDLETQAIKNGLFVDMSIVTSIPGYSVASCTVSDEKGKRMTRVTSAATVEEAMDNAGIMALSVYYGKKVPDDVSENMGKKPDPVQTPVVGEAKKEAPVNDAGTTPAGHDKPIQTPTVGSDKKEEKAPDSKPAEPGKPDPENTAKNPVTAPPANNNQAAGTAPAAAAGSGDDFRVKVGFYEKREDNYISQMLNDEGGRKFLEKVLGITSPLPKVKPYVDQISAYLTAHNITLASLKNAQ